MMISYSSIAIMFIILMFIALANIIISREATKENFNVILDKYHINKNQYKRKIRMKLEDTHEALMTNIKARMRQLGF